MAHQTNGNLLVSANGKATEQESCHKQLQMPATPSLTTWNAFVDFLMFIVASIGYILQDIYYLTFGYPEKDLSMDVALVTGGGSGLGRLLAQLLCKMGTKVVIWDINEEGINETVSIVKALGGYCKGYVVDISKKEEVYRAADIVRRDVGDVTLLINNAGVVSGTLLLDTPDYLIERSFNVNVMAHFWTTKAFLPKMIEKDRGHIVSIASLAGHVGVTKLVDYCASKFAVVGFDEALRLELDVLGYKNIETTCICPFFIQATGMFDDVNARWVPTLNPNEVAERVIKAIKTKQKIAIIPGYIKILLSLKWTFPWGCNSGLLRRLVPDAAPHGGPCAVTKIAAKKEPTELKPNVFTDLSETMAKTASILIQRTPSLDTYSRNGLRKTSTGWMENTSIEPQSISFGWLIIIASTYNFYMVDSIINYPAVWPHKRVSTTFFRYLQ